LQLAEKIRIFAPEIGIQSEKRGRAVPSFFAPYLPAMAQFDRQRIQQLLTDALGDSGLYTVDLTVSDSVMPKITATLDGPNGLGIQECAQVTRRLNRGLGETYGEEAAYSLEVTSPGADQPLTDPRQYTRHIGRSLALKLKDGTEKTGPLTAVTPEGIELEEVIKVRTKKTTLPAAFFPFGDIQEATVVISFK
jgi:ribosome maturation factor RimP